ncbi:regulator of telomere elongation helicase 1-like isoform X2 [Dreissena polymorpha]|nr:regulator of telomere elongation helicase 1-like isoform X2 [Dreissena polymorpha]XP_052274163.1 regulator of telomere elongation helicase 1-like isoform X2 [Dreissena polymorpha]XP_052274164.1 regulator of telomere elongation helicase 1-like isoform X2 [Dreissena polymorpha]XP_052274165.1 regulator of telomere elongation helicase 1-like isoform X2 [Dreissena polymorpha]XP_052274166.1 regulator of telomere elongation helicase 1-like isoform X2 [Dreissena polymorpha]
MARELKADADIIFMPYNYLLDPKTRKAHGVELQGNVVIFDEAHNLEKICEESASFDLKPGDLATAIEELTRLAEKFVEMIKGDMVEEDHEAAQDAPDFNLEDILRLKSTLMDLEKEIDKVEVPGGSGKGLTRPGMFMYELLAKANIVYSNKNIIVDLLEKIVGYVTADASTAGMGVTKGAGLTKIVDMFKIIFSQDLPPGSSLTEHQERIARSYRVHLQREDLGKKKKQVDLWSNQPAQDKMGKTLSFWCFSPGHSMSELIAHGIKCIVLTSGTLSPLDSFTAEMQIPFPVRLENPHVIQKHQVWIGTLKTGPDNTVLNSNYETRFTPAYQASLGNCIVNFARVVPNGLLIFFPSYPVMEKCLEHWKDVNIWSRIEQYKQIFVESKSKGALSDLMNDFYSKINDPSLNGAIFIAVCRGKVSEGLDFSDNNGRAVVITGLPYPPYLDPKVVLKMQYLDEMKGKQGFQSLAGKEWYKQQASRAVNQAIGRVIRHREDFGAIILCDTRFSSPDAIRQLPVWVRPHVQKYEAFGAAMKDVMVFFKHAEKTMPAPRPSKKATSGSSGAYFMPTVTRSRSGAGPIGTMPAHAVQQHVPSLMYRDVPVSHDKLHEDYGGMYDHTSSSSSKKSLFSALDHTEREQEENVKDSQDTYTNELSATSGSSQFRKPQAKKKIIIKKRDSEDSTDGVEKAAAVTSTASVEHLNSAEAYIAEVKSLLTKELYKQFSTSLVSYKKTEDIEAVCRVLTEIFIKESPNPHLFAKFYRFVRAKHKQHFSDVCLKITGLSTGYSVEDTVSRKRIYDNETAGLLAKKPKLGHGDMKNSKEGDKTKAAQPSVMDTVTDSAGNTNYVASDVPNSTKKIYEAAKDEVQSCVASVKEHVAEKTVMTSISNNKSGYICCKCSSSAKIPFRAQCDHIACMDCWRQVFESTKLCPACNKRVRRRHLVRLVFPAPPSDRIDNGGADGVCCKVDVSCGKAGSCVAKNEVVCGNVGSCVTQNKCTKLS